MNKKYIVTLIPFMMVTTGCGRANVKYTLDISVACPSGAPATGLYKYLNDEEHLEIVAANTLLGYFGSDTKDVIIAPTNAGVSQIKNGGANYLLAANITFGNFFLASTGHDDNETLDEGDYVIVFQQNNVPDKIFSYVYGDLNLDVHYVADMVDAKRALQLGYDEHNDDKPIDYVFIAEPALSDVTEHYENVTQYKNVQVDFKNKSNNLEITQASIFVNKNSDKDKINKFLADFNSDISAFLANPNIIKNYVSLDKESTVAKLGADLDTLISITKNNNRNGLGYKNALSNKSSIDNFLALWPVIGITSEEIYYK